MKRAAFLKRMALAAAACAFIDVPWPKSEDVPTATDLDSAWEQWGRSSIEDISRFQHKVNRFYDELWESWEARRVDWNTYRLPSVTEDSDEFREWVSKLPESA